MTVLRQAAEQALEALKLIDSAMPFPVAKLTIKHLQEVLAEESTQQEWVGLTNKERADCWDTIPELAMRKVEAKLKEKNT